MSHWSNCDALTRLPSGSVVEVNYSRNRWLPAVLTWRVAGAQFYLQRVGPNPSTGRPRRRQVVYLRSSFAEQQIRVPEPPSPLARQQANVFADWLDENDFPDAAKALRSAFPLIAREG